MDRQAETWIAETVESPNSCGSPCVRARAHQSQGSETVEKNACTKSKLTFTDKEGKTAEATVWEASDLKNFPIRYQTVEEEQTTTTTFSDIKMDKPDASLFALPESYKKYANMQDVMMGNMQRLMQQPPR